MTSTEYHLPALPFGGSEITILRWLKQPGDTCHAGEPLLIVANDRLEAALPAPNEVLLEANVAETGSMVAPGALVATFTVQPSPALPRTPQPRATPLARRIAATHGVALGELRGTGPAGRIISADVLRVLPTVPEPPGIVPTQHFAALTNTFVLTAMPADVTHALALCASLSSTFARRGLQIDLAPCLAQAVAAALLRFPLLNGWWGQDEIIVSKRIHLAYDLGERNGIIANAQDRNLQGLARVFSQTPAANTSKAPCPSFYLTAGGANWFQQPFPPNGTITALALGDAQPTPVIVAGNPAERITIRRIAMLTLAYDARVTDQHYADAFLREVAARLGTLPAPV